MKKFNRSLQGVTDNTESVIVDGSDREEGTERSQNAKKRRSLWELLRSPI